MLFHHECLVPVNRHDCGIRYLDNGANMFSVCSYARVAHSFYLFVLKVSLLILTSYIFFQMCNIVLNLL